MQRIHSKKNKRQINRRNARRKPHMIPHYRGQRSMSCISNRDPIVCLEYQDVNKQIILI